MAVYFAPTLWLLQAEWQDKLLDRTISACAVLVAYLLTAVTILPAIEDKQIIQRLRRWGYFDKFILGYIGRAAWAAGLLLVISLAATPFSEALDCNARFNQVYSSVWWGTCAFTVIAVYLATKILLQMVRAR